MASLIINLPGDKEKYVLLGDHRLLSVGRDDQCTVQILDPQVSRRHLQIRYDEPKGHHTAADYRSANGVFVNGVRLVREVPLKNGDNIHIGDTKIVYITTDHDSAAQAREALRKTDEWKRSTMIRSEE